MGSHKFCYAFDIISIASSLSNDLTELPMSISDGNRIPPDE